MGTNQPPAGQPFDAAATDLEAVALFDTVAHGLFADGARIPSATYRVQLNGRFRFSDVAALVDYLHTLGISDLYSSPFFQARPGSTHGYDLVDHNSLNPEIGTDEALLALASRLHAHDMGLLLDFVPNHMGIGVRNNGWWMDVLENGPSSLFAPFFDIDWNPLKHELANKVLLPILGDHYGRVLENGDFKIHFENGAFFLRYYETELPLNPRTYQHVLSAMLPSLIEQRGDEDDAVVELQSIVTGLTHLPPRTESSRAKVIERRREKEVLKKRLATLVAEVPDIEAALHRELTHINGHRGEPHSFDALHALLEDQAYRLSYWRVATEEINYRRFFDINDLAAIRMENPRVFADTHRLIFDLYGRGIITGLRIDHPDGLWDPAGYFTALQRAAFIEQCRRHFADSMPEPDDTERSAQFERLRPRLESLFDATCASDPHEPFARPMYLVVEKILSRGETLPDTWPVHGTSGYDFATSVAGVLVDGDGEKPITDIYERFIGQRIDFEKLVYQKKKLVLRTALASELAVLAAALNRLSERDRHSRDFTLGTLTDALREVIASFPVYRTYTRDSDEAVSESDRLHVARALRDAARRTPTTDASVYRFVGSVLTLDIPPTVAEEDRGAWREFVLKFQQLTGPVMAKGLEDTAFYVYNRLVSLNEVGGEPESFGQPVATFHRLNQQRARVAPGSLLATSTHDTKRSEDVRARISVLSEMPQRWAEALDRASLAARPHKTALDRRLAPDANEEYLLYQTILGSLPGLDLPRARWNEYVERLVDYMRKATKEAKVNTSWVNATAEWDAAVERFVRAVLEPGSEVLRALEPLARTVAFHGRFASLSQTLLKLTSPGVPDVYQGCESWDLSLVDPDNRRPVDFAWRRARLDELRKRREDGVSLAQELIRTAEDGRIKLFVTYAALNLRRRLIDCFGPQGAYAPVTPSGARAEHVISFIRRGGDSQVLVVVPRLTARLASGDLAAPLGEVWEDTALPVDAHAFRNAFTGELLRPDEADGHAVLRLSRVLRHFPVALLERVSPSDGDLR